MDFSTDDACSHVPCRSVSKPGKLDFFVNRPHKGIVCDCASMFIDVPWKSYDVDHKQWGQNGESQTFQNILKVMLISSTVSGALMLDFRTDFSFVWSSKCV